MKMTLKQALFASLMMVGTQAATADNGIQYNFVELRYVDLELDGSSADGDGFSIGGSYRLNGPYYIRGDYQDAEIENINIDILELGVGYIFPQDNRIDLIAEINYTDADSDVFDDDGFLFTGGLRTYINPRLEGRASINHVTFDDDDTYIQLGANYSLTDLLSVDGSFRLGGDVDELTIGLRYIF